MTESENPNYYAIIPARIRYDKDITANAKLLYGEITALCNEKGYCWASNSYFAKLYDVTPQAISKWVNSLSDKGYLKLEYEYNGKEVKTRKMYIYEVSTHGLEVSTKDELGINKGLKGYKQKVKDNTTGSNINSNTIIFCEIEKKYMDSFKEVLPNGDPILDYGAARRREKQVLSKLSKEKILLAIDRAKTDEWIIKQGFSLLTILGDNQLNKLLNGSTHSKPSYQKQDLKVNQRTTMLDLEE